MRKHERLARKFMKETNDLRMLYNLLEGEKHKRLIDDCYLGYPPAEPDFRSALCGCTELLYYPQQMIHFTEVECGQARIAFCIYVDDYGELQLRKHPIGACPDGKYEKRK